MDDIIARQAICVRTKKTNHRNVCDVCLKPVEKGEKQILLSFSTHDFVTQSIYYHVECFSCLVNILFRKLNFKHDCDKCENRFNCFSGNFEFFNECENG